MKRGRRLAGQRANIGEFRTEVEVSSYKLIPITNPASMIDLPIWLQPSSITDEISVYEDLRWKVPILVASRRHRGY